MVLEKLFNKKKKSLVLEKTFSIDVYYYYYYYLIGMQHRCWPCNNKIHKNWFFKKKVKYWNPKCKQGSSLLQREMTKLSSDVTLNFAFFLHVGWGYSCHSNCYKNLYMAYLSNSRHIHVRKAHRIQKPVENIKQNTKRKQNTKHTKKFTNSTF